MYKLLAMSLIISFLSSCASSTIIKIDDPSVKLFESDNYLGQVDIVYSNRSLSWTSRTLTMKKDGCQDQDFKIKRNEKLDVIALVTGIFLIIPLPWVMRYKAKRDIHFECVST